jgi:hypothetical protein
MRFARLLVICGLLGSSLLSACAQQSPPVQKSPPAPHPKEAKPPGNTASPNTNFAGNPEADPDTSLILENADTFEETGAGTWIGRGHVKVDYQGYALMSDRVDADLNTGEALFSGHVFLHTAGGQTVQGGDKGTLRLNLRNNSYLISEAHATVPPDELDIGIIQPIYISGGTINGRPGLIDARGSSFTTCDFLEPHYSFQARQAYVIPGRRLVGRHVTFYRKKRRLFTIPYLAVPLDKRFARQTIFPEVGQSPDEGYFIKFAASYALVSSLPGIIHLDLMQLKGIGTGFDQDYGSTNKPTKGSGDFSFYRLADNQTGLLNLTGTLNHKQQFGTVGATLTTQFQQNSYLAGDSASQAINSQLNLTRAVGNLNSSLMTSLQTSDYGAGTSSTLTSSFNQTFKPTANEQLVTKLDFSQYLSPAYAGFTGASARREIDTNLDYTQKGKVYDIEILGANFMQIGSSTTGTSFSGGVERLPEVRFATDAVRNPFLKSFLPATAHLTASFGDFIEQFSKTDTERAEFNLDVGTTTKKLDSRNTLEYGGSFQQAFYGDDTAQYILNGRTGYRLRIGQKSSAGVTYTYLKPYGYTPFQFDQTGNTNLASLSYNYQETKALQVTLGTGFDFNRTQSIGGLPATPWQNVALQTIFTPNSIFRLRTTSSYDLNRNTLLDVTNSLRVRAPGGVSLDLAGEYTPQQHTFSDIAGNLDLPFWRDPNPKEDAGYRLRAIGGYNGFTRRFTYKGLALTRSWHDFEATLVYQDTPQGLRPGSTFTFNLRLKAFPAYEPFAVGQFGQALDPSLGEVY